jgi:hypothetical protein
MGSVTNPMFSGLVPGGGMNPTGNMLSLLDLTQKGNKGANALLPNTNLSTSSVGTSNPYDIVPGGTTAPPAFPANTGPYSSSTNLGAPPGSPTTNVGQAASSPFSFLNAMSPKDLGRLFNSLKATYGDGMAHLILDFLTSGAGFNQQAINNLLASLQPGIERGEEDLMAQFGASGNRFGSGAQIGLADYLSRVNLNEGEIVTQMYQDALNRFMDVMMGTSKEVAPVMQDQPTTFDQILSGLGLGGKVSGALSGLPGISGTGFGSILGDIGTVAGAAAF